MCHRIGSSESSVLCLFTIEAELLLGAFSKWSATSANMKAEDWTKVTCFWINRRPCQKLSFVRTSDDLGGLQLKTISNNISKRDIREEKEWTSGTDSNVRAADKKEKRRGKRIIRHNKKSRILMITTLLVNLDFVWNLIYYIHSSETVTISNFLSNLNTKIYLVQF